MKPNKTKGRMPPLPDEMNGSPIFKILPNGDRVKIGHVKLHPNAPAPPREPVPDKRPHTLIPAPHTSAEEWGNAILAKGNGHGRRFD